jgi:hypothetical protein
MTYNFYFIPVNIVRQRFPYQESKGPSGSSQALKIMKTYSWEVVSSNLGWHIAHYNRFSMVFLRPFRQMPG